jgi:hypothetical protein
MSRGVRACERSQRPTEEAPGYGRPHEIGTEQHAVAKASRIDRAGELADLKSLPDNVRTDQPGS